MATQRLSSLGGALGGRNRSADFVQAFAGRDAKDLANLRKEIESNEASLKGLTQATAQWAKAGVLSQNVLGKLTARRGELAKRTDDLRKREAVLATQHNRNTKAIQGLERATRLAVGAVVTVTGVMAALTVTVGRNALEWRQMSDATGIAAERVAKLQTGFAALTGIDTAAQSLRRFADAQDLVNYRLQLGQLPTLEYQLALNNLGASLGETGQFTEETWERFIRLERGERLAAAGALGLGEAFIRAADAQYSWQEINAAGIQQTDEQIALQERAFLAWQKQKVAIQQVAGTLLAEFSPQIEKALNFLVRLIDGTAQFVSNNKELIAVIGTAVLALATLRAGLAAAAVVQAFLMALIPGGIGLVATAGLTAGIVAATFGVVGGGIYGISKQAAASDSGALTAQDAEAKADQRANRQVRAINSVETALVASQARQQKDLLLQPVTARNNYSQRAQRASGIDAPATGTAQRASGIDAPATGTAPAPYPTVAPAAPAGSTNLGGDKPYERTTVTAVEQGKALVRLVTPDFARNAAFLQQTGKESLATLQQIKQELADGIRAEFTITTKVPELRVEVNQAFDASQP